MNVAALTGRLTADPELKHTPNGIAVTSFCVAVNRRTKDRQADFIQCVAWRQTAEFVCKYFRKGQMIAVKGSIQTRNYTDRDGNKRNATEVLAEAVEFCESKKEPQPVGISDSSEISDEYEEIPDGDLPF